MSRLSQRNENVLFVEDYVSSRTQDVYLHYSPSGDPTIPRDVRRRANAVVKQPHYYNKNHVDKRSDRKCQYPDLHRLPTHHWNCKRMKMCPMWGWYLPLQHNQRDEKSFLKVVSKSTIIHDSSYYETILLQGTLSDVSTCINSLTLEPISFSKGWMSIPIYQEGLFIGPVDILCEQTSLSTTILMSCHPVISETIYNLLSKHASNNLSLIQASCCRFSIRGSHSLSLLRSFFPTLPEAPTHLSYTIVPLMEPPSIQNYYPPEYSLTEGLARQHQPLPQQLYFFQESLEGGKCLPQLSSLKGNPESSECLPQLSSLRGNSKLSKLLASSQNNSHSNQSLASSQNTSQPIEEDPHSGTLSSLFNHSSTCCLVFVNPPHQSTVSSGVELLMDLPTGKHLWQLLMNKKALAVAQKEWHHFHSFLGLPLFPYDYPDTPAGMTMCLEQYASPYVKPPAPVHLNATENCLIQMYSCLGWFPSLLPVPRSREALKKALPRFSQVEGNGSKCLIPVNLRVIGKGSLSLPCSIRIPTQEQLSKQECFIPSSSNEIMGFLTSCLYSPKASAYVGIGFCASTSLWNVLHNQHSRSNCIVLLSNPCSPSACYARLTVLNSI